MGYTSSHSSLNSRVSGYELPRLGLGVYLNDDCTPACVAALKHGYRCARCTGCRNASSDASRPIGISTLHVCTGTRPRSEKPFERAVFPATRSSSVSVYVASCDCKQLIRLLCSVEGRQWGARLREDSRCHRQLTEELRARYAAYLLCDVLQLADCERTDYIDLMLLHSPLSGKERRLEAYKALIEARNKGKVRSIGVSN